jgi:peptidoglycan/LPS O-acetylase OafA/YrhL
MKREGGGEKGAGQERIWFVHAARGFAAALVVWFHLGEMFVTKHQAIAELSSALPLNPPPAPFWTRPVRFVEDLGFNLGSFGVALFFLVSGFVIPFSLRRLSVGRFFVRRVIRIYPLYWLSLALVTVVLTLQSHRSGTSFPFSPATVASNALLINGYLGHPTIDHINWTLAIEEVFYIVCAGMTALGLLARPAGLMAVALAAGVASYLFRAVPPGLSGTIAHGLAVNASFLPYLLMGTALFQRYRGDWSTRTTAVVIAFLAAMFCGNAYKGATADLGLRSVCLSYGLALAAFIASMSAAPDSRRRAG